MAGFVISLGQDDRILCQGTLSEALNSNKVLLKEVEAGEAEVAKADETIDDVEWLARAGSEGWGVLMKDERIRYRPGERAALIKHKVRAFCLASGNLRALDMAQL